MKVSIRGLTADELKVLSENADRLGGALRILAADIERGDVADDMVARCGNEVVADTTALAAMLTDVDLLGVA